MFIFLQRKINSIHQQQLFYLVAFPELPKLVECMFSQIAIGSYIVHQPTCRIRSSSVELSDFPVAK